MDYLATVVVLFASSTISALALNLIVGYAGQLAITQGALTGAGAYTTGLLSVKLQVDPTLGILAAAGVGAVLGLAFAAATIRLAQYNFVLVSLILQLIVIDALQRSTDLTGGSSGLSGIAQPSLFGVDLSAPAPYAVYALCLLALFAVAMVRLAHSPYALSLRAFRESESSIAALGKNTVRLRMTVGIVAGFGAGIAGGLQASFVAFITPSNYTEFLSILIIVYLLVGGMGNMYGIILGVALLTALPEFVNGTHFFSVALQAPVDRIMYGLIILLFVTFRPVGVLPERRILKFGNRAPSASDDRVSL